jgi:peptidoglycan-associated lipoprotein
MPGEGEFNEGMGSGSDSLSGRGGLDSETIKELESKLTAVYFDYDRWEIRTEARATLKGHAEILRGLPSGAQVTVEGHCDERGSEEYNLALGQRRADSVQQYLGALGVPDGRLSTVSFGEEQPAVRGHDESAWRWNRRAEFRVGR